MRHMEIRTIVQKWDTIIRNIYSLFKLYIRVSRYKLQINLENRLNFWMLFVGKILRMVLFVLFYVLLFELTDEIAGYTVYQVILLFAVYNVIDIVTQALVSRGLWRLQSLVETGAFDKVLAFPRPSLLIVITQEIDWMDLFTLVPALGLLGYALAQNDIAFFSAKAGMFFVIIMLSIGLLSAINIALAAVTFYAIQVGNLWNVYNQFLHLGRFPANIYDAPIKAFLTFIVPVFIVFSVPYEYLFGGIGHMAIIGYGALVIVALHASTVLWRRSIYNYTSASS